LAGQDDRIVAVMLQRTKFLDLQMKVNTLVVMLHCNMMRRLRAAPLQSRPPTA
jgi:hypothetical protein